MAEGPSVLTQSANQSESSANMARGAGLQEESGAKQVRAYCKDQLIRGGDEFSFEELRAETYRQRRQQQLDEDLRKQRELKENLQREIDYKKKLLHQLRTSQQVQVVPEVSQVSDPPSDPPTASSFHVYEESQPAAAQHAGRCETSPQDLVDEVFLRPGETGLSLRIQCPRPDTWCR